MHFAASRERNTHIGALYHYWRRECVESPTGLPTNRTFRPHELVPEAADFLALINVSEGDPGTFEVLTSGSDVIGLQGFKGLQPVSKIVESVHSTLLFDLLWVKMDRQPTYVQTEIIVDEATLRYVYLVIPLLGAHDLIDRIQIVTRLETSVAKVFEGIL